MKDGQRTVIDEPRRDFLLRAYEQAASGESLRTIAYDFYREPVWRQMHPSDNRRYHEDLVRALLHDSFNIGLLKGVDGYVEGEWGNLVPYDLFYRFQLLHPNKAQRGRYPKEEFFMTGRIKCSDCDKPFVHESTTICDLRTGEVVHDKHGYRCRPSGCADRKFYRMEDLHAQVPALLKVVAASKGASDPTLGWDSLTNVEKTALVKVHIPQTVKVKDGIFDVSRWMRR